MAPTLDTSPVTLVDGAYAWSGQRIALVERLDVPTPCGEFDLAALLDHLAESSMRFTDVIGGAPQAWDLPGDPRAAFDVLSTSARSAWSTVDLEATYTLPIGELPGAAVAMVNATEVAVHGWDVARATGERAEIPDALANPLLAFTASILQDDMRAGGFGPAIPGGSTASERLVGFLGRDWH